MDDISTTFASISPNIPTPVPFVNTPLSNPTPPNGVIIVTLEETANG